MALFSAEETAVGTIKRTSDDGSAKVHVESMAAASGIYFRIKKGGGNDASKPVLIKKAGNKEITYSHTPKIGENITLYVKDASGTSPASARGTWED